MTSDNPEIMAFTKNAKVSLAMKRVITSEDLRVEDPKAYKLLNVAFILHEFIRKENYRGVSKILDKYPKIFEYTKEDSSAFIHAALKLKNTKFLSLLIEKGCPVDKKYMVEVQDRLYSLGGCISSSF
jgi:hypothetical protein